MSPDRFSSDLPPTPQSPALDSAVMAQVQAITAQLKTAPTQPPEQKTAFDKVRFSHITPLSVLPRAACETSLL